ncbi:MAG: hypothetical protein ACFB21_15205 [Opitutales bacterium]
MSWFYGGVRLLVLMAAFAVVAVIAASQLRPVGPEERARLQRWQSIVILSALGLLVLDVSTAPRASLESAGLATWALGLNSWRWLVEVVPLAWLFPAFAGRGSGRPTDLRRELARLDATYSGLCERLGDRAWLEATRRQLEQLKRESAAAERPAWERTEARFLELVRRPPVAVRIVWAEQANARGDFFGGWREREAWLRGWDEAANFLDRLEAAADRREPLSEATRSPAWYHAIELVLPEARDAAWRKAQTALRGNDCHALRAALLDHAPDWREAWTRRREAVVYDMAIRAWQQGNGAYLREAASQLRSALLRGEIAQLALLLSGTEAWTTDALQSAFGAAEAARREAVSLAAQGRAAEAQTRVADDAEARKWMLSKPATGAEVPSS